METEAIGPTLLIEPRGGVYLPRRLPRNPRHGPGARLPLLWSTSVRLWSLASLAAVLLGVAASSPAREERGLPPLGVHFSSATVIKTATLGGNTKISTN